jgi:hypothetical protein
MPSEEDLAEATSLTALIRISYMGLKIKGETRLPPMPTFSYGRLIVLPRLLADQPNA